jgi:energy-coupling factor transporter ATP-binding protein EcfA2
MSLYIEWLNKIKTIATSEWLTESQRSAFNKILNKWRNHEFICLCGQSGCGKTFIAQILAKEHNYIYSNQISKVSKNAGNVLIDGEGYNRLMRDEAKLKGIKRTIVVLQNPPLDRMPIAEIIITEKDVRQFQHNLTDNGIIGSFFQDPDTTDFSKIIRNESIQRGEGYADQ